MLRSGFQKLTKQVVIELVTQNDLLHEIAEKAMQGLLVVADDPQLTEELITLGKSLEAIEWSLQCKTVAVEVEV